MDLLSALESSHSQPPQAQCSRKGCRNDAQWKVLWNNPRIHEEERRKIWLACAEHRQWLEHYLQQRMFWRSTEPMHEADASSREEPTR